MNILISPNSMKGSLKASRFSEIIEEAFCKSYPGLFNILKVPVADGGDETSEIIINALELKIHHTTVKDPLLRNTDTVIGYKDEVAVIEMANASGMKLLNEDELNPLKASSFGTGELILKAIELGAKNIYLGIGGSATVDGGMGMLEALGIQFYDNSGKLLKGNGENLIRINSIKTNKLISLKGLRIKIISDVDNLLSGKKGAARVFAPQKGATPEMVDHLDKGLINMAEIIKKQTRVDVASLKGSGAAGGIAIGLIAFLNAEITQGADFILDLLSFNKHIEWADVIITGEGKFDHQSIFKKAPYVVAQRAKKYGKPVYAIVGINEYTNQNIFNELISLTDKNTSLNYAIENVQHLVYDKAVVLAKKIYTEFK